MNESNALKILTELRSKGGNDENLNEALDVAIQSIEKQMEIKYILCAPMSFAERFDCISKITKVYEENGDLDELYEFSKNTEENYKEICDKYSRCESIAETEEYEKG